MQPSARKHASESHPAGRPRIALALAGTWFALGCIVLLLVPDLRGSDPWLGWLPFWLVGVPAIEWTLLRLHRQEFIASSGPARARVRRAIAARSTSSRRVRMPTPRAGHARKATQLTALFVRQV